MSQSQTTANPRHQDEEKKDKTYSAKQTNKCTRSTKTSFLFPKRDDENAETNTEMRTTSTRRLKNIKRPVV